MKHPPIIVIPFELLTDSRLTLRHKNVLMAICSWRKSNTNLARISRQMISDRTGYSLTRVSDITTDLVKIGWLKKSGNLGKKQWSKYEIQDLNLKKYTVPKTGTTPVPKTGTTPAPKTGTTPVPKTGTSIDTEVVDTKVIDTVKVNKKISYSEKVKNFKPSEATADTFKNKYPNLGKSDYLEFIKQFKDHALNRDKQFKDFNAGMRTYIKYEYIKPVRQVVRENEIGSFRDIGEIERAKGKIKSGLPKQILINEK